MKKLKIGEKYLKFIFLISSLTTSCSRNINFDTLSKDENKYNLTTETDLKNSTYQQNIENFFKKGIQGFFKGKEGIKIYYRIFEQPSSNKAILISTGRTESFIKYKELIFDLYNNGYSIYIHDHRGQGLSDRMTKDPEMGYIDNFQFYVDDMKYFYNNYLKPKKYQKKYLLSHSMGGAIGVTYLEQNVNDFNAAVFSSPMLGLNPPICNIINLFNTDTPKYAIGQTKYKDDQIKFEENSLTGSKLRYNRAIQAYAEVPEARLGGVTYNWLSESCKQFDYIYRNINKIQTPFIIFSAENEEVVNPSAHQDFIDEAKRQQKNCNAFLVKNAQHELFIEKDKQRIATINKTLDFYSEN